MKKIICNLFIVLFFCVSTTTYAEADSDEASECAAVLAKAAEKPRLEDDYYTYVNHELLEKKKIPADASSWSQFYQLNQEVYTSLNEILQAAVKDTDKHVSGSTEQKIAALYLTAMDMEGREKAGFGALASYLEGIKNASDVDEYTVAVMKLYADYGFQSLLAFKYEVDAKNSTRYICFLDEPDFGIGKVALADEAQVELQDGYRRYISRVMQAGGMEKEQARRAAREIFDFQKDLAACALPLGEEYNPDKTYNVYSAAEMKRLLPAIDVEAMLAAGKLDHNRDYVVTQPELMRKVNSYLTEGQLDLLKNYTIFRLLDEMAGILSPELRDISLEWKQMQKGARKVKSDQKLASELVQDLLAFEFGKLYVKQHFGEADKREVKSIVDEMLAMYAKKIDALTWMSAETKAAAKKKLRTMGVKIGYPDVWPDAHAAVRLKSPQEGGCLLNNWLELRKSDLAYMQALYQKPVDRSLWDDTPQTVNAYYNPSANEIMLPAAILQAPFYDRGAEKATNLGGVGMVIAHEISHAFDNQGAKYDEKGNYYMWWTPEDKEKFEKLSQRVVDYYNGFSVIGGRRVNGAQTLGENIADLGAISCVTAVAGNDPRQLRLLFEQFARIWAEKSTEQYQIFLLNEDVHSPSKVRVNAVSSATDAFYLAYPELKPGDGMYLPQEKG